MNAKKTSGSRKPQPRKPRAIQVVEDLVTPTTETMATESTKPAAKQSAAKEEKKLSALNAAALVLRDSNEPMNAKQMVEAMTAKGYWSSPGGKTPHATLYSAILREIDKKGSASRFTKADRGKFTLTPQGAAE